MRQTTPDMGLGLVNLLVALALAGIFGVLLMTFMSNRAKEDARFSGKETLEEFRNTLRRRLDCTRTLGAMPMPCADGTPISLKDKHGEDLIRVPDGQGFQRTGKRYLMASCTAEVNQFMAYWTEEPPAKDGSWRKLFKVPFVCEG